jgi:hypothetical protein
MDNQLLLADEPSPTTPPLIHRRHRVLRRAEVVTVTSFADQPSATQTHAAAKSVPIGPIVGGIVAGVVAVLLVGGIWWWCYHKSEKERKVSRFSPGLERWLSIALDLLGTTSSPSRQSRQILWSTLIPSLAQP